MNLSAKMYLSSSEVRLVEKYRASQIETRRRSFEKRKLNHLHKEGLKSLLMPHYSVLPPVLYLISFRRYVSPYLYLYLKGISESFHPGSPFSKPLQVNISRLAVHYGASRNTLKRAYLELLELGLLLDVTELASNKPHMCSVIYDEFIIGYNDLTKKVVYKNS